jgi:DNA-binding winged helix-turn-helix (wHTH) protein
VDLGFVTRLSSEGRRANASSIATGTAGGAIEASPRNATDASTRKTPARCVLFGDFELDLQAQSLRRSGEAIKIPGKIYQAMVVLIESPGDLVTRDQIRDRLWPRDAQVNYDANVNTTVNKLRQMLGDTSEGSNFIQTIPRRGYSFVAPVRYADAPAVRPNEEKSGETTHSRTLAGLGDALRSERARIWFTASVVTWVTAAVLFASMLLWHSHQVRASANDSAKVMGKQAIGTK